MLFLTDLFLGCLHQLPLELINGRLVDALDLLQALERAVPLTVVDDGLGHGRADAFQGLQLQAGGRVHSTNAHTGEASSKDRITLLSMSFMACLLDLDRPWPERARLSAPLPVTAISAERRVTKDI